MAFANMMYYKAVRDVLGAVRDVRPQAGISKDEHDYTIKRFHDFF